MAQRLRTLTRLLLGLSLCTVTLRAQDATAPATEKEETFPNRDIVFYGFGDGKIKDIYYYSTPDNPTPLAIYNWSRGTPFNYRGPNTFKVYVKVPGAEGEPDTYRAVGSVELPGGASNVLIVIERTLKASEPGGPAYALNAINDDLSQFSTDELAFYNTMKTTFACMIGETKLALPPGLSEAVSLDEMMERPSNRLAVAAVIKDGPKIILDIDVRFLPGKRYLYVLLPPEKSGSTVIRALKIIDRPSS